MASSMCGCSGTYYVFRAHAYCGVRCIGVVSNEWGIVDWPGTDS